MEEQDVEVSDGTLSQHLEELLSQDTAETLQLACGMRSQDSPEAQCEIATMESHEAHSGIVGIANGLFDDLDFTSAFASLLAAHPAASEHAEHSLVAASDAPQQACLEDQDPVAASDAPQEVWAGAIIYYNAVRMLIHFC